MWLLEMQVFHAVFRNQITANAARRTEARGRAGGGGRPGAGGGLRPRGRRAAGERIPAEVTGGQLRSWSCSFSRARRPCSKRQTSLRCLLSLETGTLPKLKCLWIHFSEFSVLHIILVFFTRKTAKLLTRSPNCKASPGEKQCFQVPFLYHRQLAGIKREKTDPSCTAQVKRNLKPFLEKERLYLEDVLISETSFLDDIFYVFKY